MSSTYLRETWRPLTGEKDDESDHVDWKLWFNFFLLSMDSLKLSPGISQVAATLFPPSFHLLKVKHLLKWCTEALKLFLVNKKASA